MIVLIEHDDAGEIKSVACCASGDAGMMRRVPSPGCSIAEIEVELKDERDIEGLQHLVRHCRVTGHPHTPRLITK